MSKSDTPDFQAAVEAAVKAAIEQVMPVTAALIAKAQGAKPVAVIQSREQCSECFQHNMACGGEHEEMAVFPKDPRTGKFFEGVWVNGVRYLSNNANHRIKIPKKSDIHAVLQAYEHNEIEQAQGRQGGGLYSGQSTVGQSTAPGWR